MGSRTRAADANATSGISSSDRFGKRSDRAKAVALEKLVDVGEGGSHALRRWFVAGAGFERIDPDELVRKSVETFHRRRHGFWITSVPSVGEHHDDCPSGHTSDAPLAHEAVDRIAESGPARPVLDHPGCGGDSHLGVSRRQLAGDAGEAGAEREHLHRSATGNCCVSKSDQDPGIAFHRTADVEQQHEPTGLVTGFGCGELDWFAGTTHGGTDRATQIGGVASA